ncbi:FliA/WhiG family RNA polymerase sigma factor [Piscinibacter sp. XHJ-5]|uniref:sigma-70 family RNA polymerase sigma factor n=1 Tax=Piscinibacter sp. XHJ-5 TaxID=3037797 RepID=UPI002452A9A6|nr:FliA/WhiG family RNA polymerase sigma factor [Piscinibacter sp. XHJ-5]
MNNPKNNREPCQRSADLAAHKPLVRQIARRIRARLPPNVGLDELEQAGLLGLNQALSRFEQGRGSSFETYAARRIEGSMLDALREMDTLSRDARARLREVQAAVQKLEHRLGRAPRAKEVANELGWTLEQFHRCMLDAGAGGARAGEIDLENVDDDSAIWAGAGSEHAVIDEQADPLQALQQRQRHAALNAAFDALEEAERYVMESIYRHGLTLRDIGQTLGVSESRVSRMASEIVAKLRRRLRDW